MIWRDRMLTANTAVTGQAHSTAKQHVSWCPTKWCLSSSGSVCLWVFQSVSDYTCDCARGYDIVHLVCVIFFFHVCVCVCVRNAFDGQRADKKCQRSSRPANPACQVSPVGPAATVIGPPCLPHSQNGRLADNKNIPVSQWAPQPGHR